MRTHVTVAISLHPELRAQAQRRAEALGFRNSFSAYVAKLIADDLHEQVAAPSSAAAELAAILEKHGKTARGNPSGSRSATARRKGKGLPQ
jgi:hypothetical protein